MLANGLVKGFGETLSQNIIWKVTKINLILTIYRGRRGRGRASIQQPCFMEGGNRYRCGRVQKQANLEVEGGYARAEATRLNFHTALLEGLELEHSHACTLSASSLCPFLSPMHICVFYPNSEKCQLISILSSILRSRCWVLETGIQMNY